MWTQGIQCGERLQRDTSNSSGGLHLKNLQDLDKFVRRRDYVKCMVSEQPMVKPSQSLELLPRPPQSLLKVLWPQRLFKALKSLQSFSKPQWCLRVFSMPSQKPPESLLKTLRSPESLLKAFAKSPQRLLKPFSLLKALSKP